MFRNRKTGKFTIAQFPNLSLGIYLVGSAVRRVIHPGGTPGTLLLVLASVALAWWAVDEIARGVNPWRRALGAGILTDLTIRSLLQ